MRIREKQKAEKLCLAEEDKVKIQIISIFKNDITKSNLKKLINKRLIENQSNGERGEPRISVIFKFPKMQ